VTVTYDADKTNVENLIAGFKKIGYTATEVKGGCCQGKKDQAQQKDDCCK
jgi:hypothetical protein